MRLARSRRFARVVLLVTCGVLLVGRMALAEVPLRVAVAANFVATAEQLREAFGHELLTVHPGATGQLYAQIRQGAPYDFFLSADSVTAERLADEGLAVVPPQVYAVGRLALWSPGHKAPEFSHLPARLVQADPKLAPYGAAAEQCVKKLAPAWQGQWLKGTSVSQAHQMLASGAASAGFVAWSQVLHAPREQWRLLPVGCHAPLAQKAVWLKRGAQHHQAQAFWQFISSSKARKLIAKAGYVAP